MKHPCSFERNSAGWGMVGEVKVALTGPITIVVEEVGGIGPSDSQQQPQTWRPSQSVSLGFGFLEGHDPNLSWAACKSLPPRGWGARIKVPVRTYRWVKQVHQHYRDTFLYAVNGFLESGKNHSVNQKPFCMCQGVS